MFDTKIAFIIRNDLLPWQQLNVVAFLATGIVSVAPEIMGKPYIDSLGRQYGNMSGQPMLIFEADIFGLQNAHRKGLERELVMIPYIYEMFKTNNDESNRQVFQKEDANNLNLVGLAFRGSKKTVDKVVKGLSLHP